MWGTSPVKAVKVGAGESAFDEKKRSLLGPISETDVKEAKVEKKQVVVEAVKEFDQMDANGDGVIDKEEWVNAKTKVDDSKAVEVPVDDDEEEVTVVEYKYKGTTYLLDPESKKVYNMEQEFVGKLSKKTIDFDAVDSDGEE